MDGNGIISVQRQAPAGTGSPRAFWSRRFVAQGLLTIAAAAPVLARAGIAPPTAPSIKSPPDSGAGKAANAGRGPPQDAGSGAVRSASETDDRLTTAVYINGQGPFRFLVDTGAERTLLAAEIAAQLALPQGRPVLIEGITGDRPGMLVEIETLRMGSLVCPPLEVPVLPRKMLTVDGYLGLDVLDRRRVILDFRAGTLSVTRPQGFFAALFERGDEAVVHTLGSSGRLRASNCLVNGVRAAAFVDTGAQVSVLNPALFAALQKQHRQLLRGPVGLYGVTGGVVTGVAVNIDDIRMDQLRLTYTPMVVAPLQVFDVWGLSNEPALLFGMDCLRRFARVSIDYRRKELRFELASTLLPQPLQAGLPPPLVG